MNATTPIDIGQVMRTYAQDTVILAKDKIGAMLDYSGWKFW
jgi:hypothetical protein